MNTPRKSICFAHVVGVDPHARTAWVAITKSDASELKVNERMKVKWTEVPKGNISTRLNVPQFNEGTQPNTPIEPDRSIMIEVLLSKQQIKITKWCYFGTKALNGHRVDNKEYSFKPTRGSELFGTVHSLLKQLGNHDSWPEGTWGIYDEQTRRFTPCHVPEFPTPQEETGDEAILALSSRHV